MKNVSPLTRRSFITSASGFLLGSGFLSLPLISQEAGQTQKVMKEALTPDELEWVENSVMARDLNRFFGEGYSCAESLLMVVLRYLKKPEELVWAAAGFGGGLGQRDLCGFLTAGVMGIGFFCGGLEVTRDEAKKTCRNMVKDYWKWWTETSPLHCRNIRPEGSSSKICVRLGQLAAAKVEGLMEKARV